MRPLLPLLLSALACAGASPADASRKPSPAAQDAPMTATPPPPGPPGPPPGPPGPPPDRSADAGPVDPASPKGRYLAWLGEPTPDPATVQTWRPEGTGDWGFFFVQPSPGIKQRAAAVGPGVIVTASEPAGWQDLLHSAPVDEVQRRIAWLNGAWIPLAPDAPQAAGPLAKHQALADHLTAPQLQTTGGTTTFTAWYAEPPAMMSFRLTVTATEQGTTFERTPLAKLTP